jgi:preprotein translocase subunit Sss1
MMYWRNMKIKIIVGLMVLGLIGFVILIIVKTSQNKSS